MERIRIGVLDWELCDDLGCYHEKSGRAVLPNGDFHARQWLFRLKDDVWMLSALRRLVRDAGLPAAGHATDHELLEHVEIALRSGCLHVCRQAEGAKQSGGGGSAKEAGGKQEERITPAPVPVRTKTWIEFEVVDMEGKPVTNQRYIAMLPDGSLHEGKLGKTGVVRFEKIDWEICVFTLPDLDKEAWERV